MSIKTSFTICLLLTFFLFKSYSQNVKNNLTTTESLDKDQVSLMFENIKLFPDNFQASFAFIKNGKTSFYGVKKENNTIFNIANQDSIFEIASISKVFTATLLAKYEMMGSIHHDEQINEYIPFTLNDDVKITFKQLANHTSGLPRIPTDLILYAMNNPEDPYVNYAEEVLIKHMSEIVKLNNQPGETYEYSNLGMGFLGYVLSQLEKKDYETMLSEYIFSKYGMLSSTSLHSKGKKGLVKGIGTNGKEVANWNFAALAGAGGILSSTSDLTKFIKAQFLPDQEHLELTREKTWQISDKMDIGLGWHIIHTSAGKELFWHNGATGGYTSSLAFNIENKSAAIILTNISAFDSNSKNIDNLCFDLMKSLE